jgi:Outer membrane protein and related peptidoglycan-associated (lipo)proteins
MITKIVKDTVYIDKPIPTAEVPEVWFHINFIVDRWDISKKELVNINAVADLIKSTPNTKYLVCGYADKQTATPAHNLMLSENRANAVYDALVKEFGVDPNQLIKDFKGGVDYMFYNMKELSRCVMITSIKE